MVYTYLYYCCLISFIISFRYELTFGDHDVTVTTKFERTKRAEKIFVHQNYKHSLLVNDIALVKLKDKVELTKFVRTLCLPEKELAIPDEYGFVAGWGVTQTIKPGDENKKDYPKSKVLQYSAFSVQNNSLCSNKTKYHVNETVTFCAGHGKGGNDTCKGDSGGPFVREDRVGDDYRWMATGLVSWGEGCAWKDKYGYYTRVAPFVDWIQKTIKANT